MSGLDNIVFNPPIPAQHAIGCGVLLGVLAAVAYAVHMRRLSPGRAAFLLGLRLASIALLTVLLLRPMREERLPDSGRKPVFTILLDTSGSMNTADARGRPRVRAVLDRLEGGRAGFLRKLASLADVRVMEFADTTRPVELPELAARAAVDGRYTHVGQALLAAAATADARAGHAGILLVSDGRDNSGQAIADALLALKTRQVPVWTVCVGTPEGALDVSVTARLSQGFLFVAQPAELRVMIHASGAENRQVNVHLHREDEYIGTRQVVLRRGVTSLDFPVREEHKGLFRYRVTVDPIPGEADAKNNARTVFARVVDEKTRVLVVEAQPHWDGKFMLRALQQDPNLEVTSIFHLSPTRVFSIREETSPETLQSERQDVTLHMPRTRDELDRYDCLVLGRDMDTLLSADEMGLLRGYLTERGGCIVFFRGKFYEGESDAARIEPVTWGEGVLRDATLDLTAAGRVSPVFAFDASQTPDAIVRALPPLASVTRIREEKALAVVLAVGRAGTGPEAVATISHQRYGKGKVMSIGASGLWRWALIPNPAEDLKDVHERFWRQIVQWMVSESDFLPGQSISFRATGYTFQPGQRAGFSVSTHNVDVKQYRPRLTVQPPSGAPIVLEPSPLPDQPADYSAWFTPEEEGEYSAVLHNNVGAPKEDVVRFTVYSDQVENRLVATDPELLETIAGVTGGGVLGLDALDGLPACVKRFDAAARERRDLRDAWPRLPVLALLAGLLGVEWLNRKRWGLA